MYMPDGILCSSTHEWVCEENDIATIGLTDVAIEHLGEILFIELPEANMHYSKDEPFATINSTKGAHELYMPVSGKIVEVNEQLINSVELLNEDCYSNWLIKIEPDNFAQDVANLMEYSDYIDEMK